VLVLKTSIVRRPLNVHTFTYKRLSASDRWRHSFDSLEVCPVSPTLAVSVCKMVLLVRWPRNIHTFICKRLSIQFSTGNSAGY